MNGVTFEQILRWTEADLVGIFDSGRQPAEISSDTRTIADGDLFLALQGARLDGHEYVVEAFAKGAAAAVVERQWQLRNRATVPGPLFVVDSALQALGSLARNYRKQFDIPVIAIVGSSGKTTAKELTAAVLGTRYRVLKSVENENNEIGIPMALLRLSEQHEVAVLEFGTRKFGDIAYLCSLAQPTAGVLLIIGRAHLEFFESVEGVAKAKGELLDYLGESSLTLVNVDDCVAAREAMRTKGRLLGFSIDRESQFRGEGLVLDREGRGHFSLQNYDIEVGVAGRHNVYNALVAAALGREFGVDWGNVCEAISAFHPIEMRTQVLRKGENRIINDSYNANPESMRAALTLLRDMGSAEGRMIAVLGDMLELGNASADLHADIGRFAAAIGIDMLFCTGQMTRQTITAALESGMEPENVRHFCSRSELRESLSGCLGNADVVLVKGSRGMELEQVVQALLN